MFAALLGAAFCLDNEVDDPGLLVAVGSVTESSARLVIEDLSLARHLDLSQSARAQTHVSSTVVVVVHSRGSDGSRQEVTRTTVDGRPFPVAVSISDLDRGLKFEVDVWRQEQTKALALPRSPTLVAEFWTASPTQPADVMFMSCNRVNEDGDTSMWKQLLDKEFHKRAFGTVMMGDQVYMDRIVLRFAEQGDDRGSYWELLEQFRDVYRLQWGHTRETAVAMRHGAHWTLPDDHEFFNNLIYNLMATKLQQGVGMAIQAARQAFYEYQTQLNFDIEDVIEEMEKDADQRTDFDDMALFQDQKFHVPLYQWVDIGDTAIVLLDVRFERTFHHSDCLEREFALTGRQQALQFQRDLNTKGKHASHIVVATQVPFGYPSPFGARVAYLVEDEEYMNLEPVIGSSIHLLEMMMPMADKVSIVAGDIHFHLKSRVCSPERVCFNQTSASGMSSLASLVSAPHVTLFHGIQIFLGSSFPFRDWVLDITDFFNYNHFVVLNTTKERSSGESWN